MAMNQQLGQQPRTVLYSLDGTCWWDGHAWRTVQLSPDERWRWDGAQWVPNQRASTPCASTLAGAPPRPPLQGAAPVPDAATTRGLAHQFTGDARLSIVFGVISVVVPLFTPIYFPIMPIFGLWRGVLAVRRGGVAGGVIGLLVNTLGCLVSLLASGLLNAMLH
jgi:hypothetical protein